VTGKEKDILISDYEIELVEPGCTPGSGRFGVEVTLKEDISPVMPYLNAVYEDTWYDRENRIFILREPDQAYAFRPLDIRIARANDPLHARLAAAEIVDRVNHIWQRRESITPRYTEKKLPAVIDIYKLLPKINCRECGCPTCLAYAAELRRDPARLEDCPRLMQPEYDEDRKKIAALFSVDQAAEGMPQNDE
jgi:ArsR family metal-binding transcriptional regulator